MQLYSHPKSLPRSTAHTLRINGQPVETLFTGVADFAICALSPSDFPAQVEIVTNQPLTDLVIRPVAKNIIPTIDAAKSTIRFTLSHPVHLSIDPGYGRKPLYLFANGPETNPPAPGTPGVVTFPAGQITEVAELALEDGQTLYLPGGAVLKGRVHIKGKRNVRICGHGLLDGSYHPEGSEQYLAHGMCTIDDCDHALIEDITLVRTFSWTMVLACSRHVTVRNVHIVCERQAGDGIDVVGSSDVLIEDSFVHANDDCIVVKALHLGRLKPEPLRIDGRRNVDKVLARRCTLANWHAGNAMEIGHELCVDTIRNITFRDIDVLHVHGTGAVFSIHNVDRAAVTDVLWENIRIEHCYDKLIDFRVTQSRYSTEVEPTAAIRRVTLRDIHWSTTKFNAGYTTSLISGRAADQPVEDIVIDRFFIDGKPVRHLDELDIHTRHVTGLRLAVSAS